MNTMTSATTKTNTCGNCTVSLTEDDWCGYEGHDINELFGEELSEELRFRCCSCLSDLTGETCEYIAPNVIDPLKVRTTYKGKLGCACGCNGDYTEELTATAVERIAKVNHALQKGVIQVVGRKNAYEPRDWTHGVVIIIGDEELVYCLETTRSAVRVYVAR
jgi:hypothetical protein